MSREKPTCLLDIRWLHARFDLELWRIQDRLFHRALIRNFNQSLMIFLREIGGHHNFDDELIEYNFPTVNRAILKALQKGNVLRRNFSRLTKAEHIYPRTCSYGCQEIFIRRRCRPFAAILHRLIGDDGEPLEVCLYSFAARECDFDFDGRLLLFDMLYSTFRSLQHVFAFSSKLCAVFFTSSGPFSLTFLITSSDARCLNNAFLFFLSCT